MIYNIATEINSHLRASSLSVRKADVYLRITLKNWYLNQQKMAWYSSGHEDVKQLFIYFSSYRRMCKH